MLDNPTARPLSVAAFQALRALITAETGIVLSDGKRNFVAARLLRRLRALGLDSYELYYAHAKAHKAELEQLVNAITTNKTSFFREEHHFAMLVDELIPTLQARARARGDRRVRVWSAGCSSGEEAYSIAMVLHEHFPAHAGWDVRILASDIDTDVLARAEAGMYARVALADVPERYRERYFETVSPDTVRVSHQLRSLISFRHINLNVPEWPIRTRFDAIFCRNVVIYFDQQTQRPLFTRFAGLMQPYAPLVLGHSETLHWYPDVFRHGGNTTYYLRPQAERAAAMPPMRSITVGQVFATREPTTVRTLLGSCVAVCLYDPEAKVGGMNHFMLPGASAAGDSSARFGTHAMDLLISAVVRQGADRKRLQAKIFGGAHVIDIPNAAVPEKNIAFIREYLATAGVPVKAELLGGEAPLDVRMSTDTGKVLARRLDTSAVRKVVDAESQFAERLR